MVKGRVIAPHEAPNAAALSQIGRSVSLHFKIAHQTASHRNEVVNSEK
jgi:hypothetical protein